MNRDDAIATLTRNHLLAGLLDEQELDWLAGRLVAEDVEAGQTILEPGPVGTTLFFIHSGKVQVLGPDEAGGQVLLTTLAEGELFGERSLIEHAPISTTVRAAEPCTLLKLDLADFEVLLRDAPSLTEVLAGRIREYTEVNFLRGVRLLAGLSREEVLALLGEVQRVDLAAGEFLFHEGDPGDALYIVRSGAVRVIKESVGGALLSELKPGAILGEMALAEGKPRNAAAQAIETTRVLRLGRAEYERIEGAVRMPEPLRRQMAQRLAQQVSALYASDTPEGRAAILHLMQQPDGVQRYWQWAKQEHEPPRQALAYLGRAAHMGVLVPTPNLLTDVELVRRVPRSYAGAHQVLPVFSVGGEVEVLATTPLLGTVLRELERMLNQPVCIRLTEPGFLEKLIERSYLEGAGTEGGLPGLDESQEWEELDSVEDLKDQAQAAPIIKLVNNIFVEAIARKASDIHIDPYEEGIEVRYRIDGILNLVSQTPRRFQAAVISRIKIMADLDIAERRIPQDGRISLRLEGKSFDIRVATIPTVFGEGTVMRILDKSSVQIDIHDVGFTAPMLETWEGLITRSNGVVLVTGPTGSGKTTTLYATLNRIKGPEVKIITAEDPVEYQLHGIEQVQINSKVGLTFAATLRSMLRLDPDIVMVGEIRDHETAEIAIQAALTGHLVFSTLHTNDAATTLTRLVEMGIEPYLVASAVNGALAQRLVRKLCPACKRQDEGGRWLAVGCSQCGNSGYKGRLGIYELLVLTDPLRELIVQKADAGVIGAAAAKAGMLSIWDDGMAKVASGLTTEEEVRRVAS